MKKLFLMFIFLSAFVSCGGETKETDKCDGVSCQEWKECNSANGNCELKTGRCDSNNNCYGNQICNSSNYCIGSIMEMDIYEVTAGEFARCVAAGNCTNTNYKTNSYNSDCNLNKVGKENHPMNCVNWFGADEYCRWKGKVLPTEEEWENAAKGGEDYIYSGSDNPNEVAWYSANSGNTTHQVGTKAANGYGLYDMSGNVSEWTNSWYDSYKLKRVVCGGSFTGDDIRVDSRHDAYPNSPVFSLGFGFRCVQ